MTIYYVGDKEFFTLTSAKQEMKSTGLTGTKVKVYSNGDWVPCGKISLSKSNKCHIVGSTHCDSY